MKCRYFLPVLVLTALAWAQPLEFEAASVKLAVPPPGHVGVAQFEAGRFVADAVCMRQLIEAAYPYQAGQEIVGPAWVGSLDNLYNVEAKTSGAVPAKDMRVMLQHLLAERFGLQLHTKERPAQAFALVQTAKGFQIRSVQFDGPDPNIGSMHIIRDGVEFSHASMKMVAGYLSWTGHEVKDETGIQGLFDFRFLCATRGGLPALDPAIESDQPSIFAALEKIGLKLENRQGTVTDYIIDRVERTPSEN